MLLLKISSINLLLAEAFILISFASVAFDTKLIPFKSLPYDLD
jgi:hypothetical protein